MGDIIDFHSPLRKVNDHCTRLYVEPFCLFSEIHNELGFTFTSKYIFMNTFIAAFKFLHNLEQGFDMNRKTPFSAFTVQEVVTFCFVLKGSLTNNVRQ